MTNYSKEAQPGQHSVPKNKARGAKEDSRCLMLSKSKTWAIKNTGKEQMGD